MFFVSLCKQNRFEKIVKSIAQIIITILLAMSVAFVGCDKTPEIPVSTTEEDQLLPVLSMVEVADITSISASGKAILNDEGGSAITEKGFCWSEKTSPTINDSKYVSMDQQSQFGGILSELQPNTTYYVRAYAINSYGVGYSSALSFTTRVATAPPVISVIAEEGYLCDDMVIEVGVTYYLGFHVESALGLSSLTITANEDPFDAVNLSGMHTFEYRNTVVVNVGREIIGEYTFTAVVTDVNGQSSSTSLRIQVNYEAVLEVTPFEWHKEGVANGEGLEQFGLCWIMNSKEVFARIKPLDGVLMYAFDSQVWDAVNTPEEKANAFLEVMENGYPLSEYHHVSVTHSSDYDDVIGTIIPDGTIHLIHITHCEIIVDSMTHITISGEAK